MILLSGMCDTPLQTIEGVSQVSVMHKSKGIILMLKKVYNAVLYYLFVALLIEFLFSCAYTHNIAGRWQEPGKTSSIEFGQDGTFKAVDNMGMAVSGNYILQEKGKIRLEIKHPDSSAEILIGILAVQGDELMITFDEGKEVLRYKKAQ